MCVDIGTFGLDAAAAAAPSSGAGDEGASKRADNASTMRSTIFLAFVPSGSLSGLYWATSRPNRLLLRANSRSAPRTSSRLSPPLAGTFTGGKSSCAMTSRSTCRTNSRVSACARVNASVAAVACAFCSDIFGGNVAQRRLAQEFLFGRSSRVIPNSVTSGSRTSGVSPQKRTSSGAPRPMM